MLSVFLNVYDVSKSETSRQINNITSSLGLGGAFHGAIEVFDPNALISSSSRLEWSFGFSESGHSGVYSCTPTKNPLFTFRETLDLGTSKLTACQFLEELEQLKVEWPGVSYDMLSRNCCHFCQALTDRLQCRPIPSWLNRMARRAEATLAFSNEIKQMVVSSAVHIKRSVAKVRTRILPKKQSSLVKLESKQKREGSLNTRSMPITGSINSKGRLRSSGGYYDTYALTSDMAIRQQQDINVGDPLEVFFSRPGLCQESSMEECVSYEKGKQLGMVSEHQADIMGNHFNRLGIAAWHQEGDSRKKDHIGDNHDLVNTQDNSNFGSKLVSSVDHQGGRLVPSLNTSVIDKDMDSLFSRPGGADSLFSRPALPFMSCKQTHLDESGGMSLLTKSKDFLSPSMLPEEGYEDTSCTGTEDATARYLSWILSDGRGGTSDPARHCSYSYACSSGINTFDEQQQTSTRLPSFNMSSFCDHHQRSNKWKAKDLSKDSFLEESSHDQIRNVHLSLDDASSGASAGASGSISNMLQSRRRSLASSPGTSTSAPAHDLSLRLSKIRLARIEAAGCHGVVHQNYVLKKDLAGDRGEKDSTQRSENHHDASSPDHPSDLDVGKSLKGHLSDPQGQAGSVSGKNIQRARNKLAIHKLGHHDHAATATQGWDKDEMRLDPVRDEDVQGETGLGGIGLTQVPLRDEISIYL